MVERRELVCLHCGHTTLCGPEAMLDWLRRAKKVRRGKEPEPELIGELFRAAAGQFECSVCGGRGLQVRAPTELDDEAWGMARACQQCGRPIARERLESLPDAVLCVECQSRDDRGESAEPAEYCPKCGTPMTVRMARTGLARYVLTCPRCRR